jgi:very-short-patch-repair endonuclease
VILAIAILPPMLSLPLVGRVGEGVAPCLKKLTPMARRLRREATAAERRLWGGIRREQIGAFKFRRQVVLKDFIVDFACLEARLIVEVDGATHSTDAELARDAARSSALKHQGYEILRFANDEVFHNYDGVLETIRLKLLELRPRLYEDVFEGGATPPPWPSPTRGEGMSGRPQRRLSAQVKWRSFHVDLTTSTRRHPLARS